MVQDPRIHVSEAPEPARWDERGDTVGMRQSGPYEEGNVRAIIVLLSGCVGVLLVRYFMLEPLELLGWKMFWGAIGQGNVMNLDMVFNSSTFWKCVAGFVILGVAGFFVGGRFRRAASAKAAASGEA